jgi:hypothetical protein
LIPETIVVDVPNSVDRIAATSNTYDKKFDDAFQDLTKIRSILDMQFTNIKQKAADIEKKIPDRPANRLAVVPMSYGPVDNACIRR